MTVTGDDSDENVQTKNFACFNLKQVSANLYSAHMDPTVWIDPQTFKPDRFLRDSNRQDVINKDTIIPFSMGLHFLLQPYQ